jgi:diacylglycerol kinase family enzyme
MGIASSAHAEGNNHTRALPAMRVALYYNPTAGIQTLAAGDVTRLLRDEGHAVDVHLKGHDAIDEAIDSRPQVIVAAGGDGTVAKVARALWKHRSTVPLFVIPLGSSNNIARTLGLSSIGVPLLVRGLASARDSVLDVGTITLGGRDMAFVEGAGAGFFGKSMHHGSSVRGRLRRALRRVRGIPGKGETHVRRAAEGFARLIRRAPVRAYRILADGVDFSGDYLAVEIMNIQSIGPRMLLAPDANPSDGLLDLVLIHPEGREALAALVEQRISPPAHAIERRRVHEVELSWPANEGHVDDEPWPRDDYTASDAGLARIVSPGSLHLLLPRAAQ